MARQQSLPTESSQHETIPHHFGIFPVIVPVGSGKKMKLKFISLLTGLLICAPLLARAQIETMAGVGKPGFSGDNGPAAQAQINNPYGLTMGPDGALYFCDMGNHRIRKISGDGIITTVAGNGAKGWSGDDGPALEARLNEPYEVRFDKLGNMFFVEMRNHIVRRVDAKTRVITTVVGQGRPGFNGESATRGTDALLSQPHSIQFISESALAICDIGNHRLREYDIVTSAFSTIGGTGEKQPAREGKPLQGNPLNGPRAIDVAPDGAIWLALREGNAIYRIEATRRIMHRAAGTGIQGFAGNDGPALEATLSGPKGISVARNGCIIWADTESHTIRYLDPHTQIVHLLVGTGQKGDGPDGDPLKCKLNRPHGVFADAAGYLWIGDSENHRIRRLRIDTR